jgi:GlpG protein
MRHIGTLPDAGQAQTFIDYLLVRGVKGATEHESDGWSIWIYDEDQVPLARTELERFRQNPNDPQVVTAATQAAAVRASETQRAQQQKRQVVDIRKRWQRPTSASLPLSMMLAVLCFGISVLGDFGKQSNQIYDDLSFASRETWETTPLHQLYTVKATFRDISKGEVWRLVTPMFLHFSYTHLLFNTYSLIVFGGMLEYRLGAGRTLLLVLLFSLFSNLPQAVMQGPHFGGFSGVIFGMFGYIWMKSRFDPGAGFYISPMNVVFTLIFFFTCMTGRMGPIANWAHWGGLVTGIACGYLPTMLTPRRRAM